MATSATATPSQRATGITRIFLEALAKFSTARLREIGALGVHPDWQTRAAICERCPLKVVQCGVSYCGKPLLRQLPRDPTTEGCGCPCHDKAKSPKEHCPIDAHHQPAHRDHSDCTCKWCAA